MLLDKFRKCCGYFFYQIVHASEIVAGKWLRTPRHESTLVMDDDGGKDHDQQQHGERLFVSVIVSTHLLLSLSLFPLGRSYLVYNLYFLQMFSELDGCKHC